MSTNVPHPNLRNRHLGILLISLLLGISILIYRGLGWIYLRGYGGDVVVVIFIYFLIRLLSSLTGWKIALFTFLLACVVETNQLWWGIIAEQSFWSTVVAGTTFDWLDIATYALGALLALALDVLCSKHAQTH